MSVDRRVDAALLDFSDERPRSLGESALPDSGLVREAMLRAVNDLELRRYPDVRPRRLESALALRHRVPPESIVVGGGGSIELIARCVRAFTLPGESVHALAPTFDHLPVIVAREHRRPCLGSAWPSSTALAYLASPNNPDSRVRSFEELALLRRTLAPDRVLLVDRAWAGWESEDELWRLPPPGADGPMVFLHSLSKLFGLAGLRVGYAVAPVEVAEVLRRYSPGYEVSGVVEAAALAAVSDEAHRARARALVGEARARLTAELERRGWEVRPSTTNVVLARPPAEVLDALDELALPIERCGQLDAVQLTVPLPGEIDRWLSRLDARGTRASRRP